jgi:hypothetical protein
MQRNAGGTEKTKTWVVYCPENLRKKRRFLEKAVQRSQGAQRDEATTKTRSHGGTESRRKTKTGKNLTTDEHG